jgi:hypothetical protein
MDQKLHFSNNSRLCKLALAPPGRSPALSGKHEKHKVFIGFLSIGPAGGARADEPKTRK